MNYIPNYAECFFKELEAKLYKEWVDEDIDDISKQEYIQNRIREIARELVEVTDSNDTIAGRLDNLEAHTHDVHQSISYDELYYSCSRPVY